MNDFKGIGLLIKNVLEGGPAEKAGIRDGDVIISIDNAPISDWSQYAAAIKPGVPYDLEVLRGNQLLTFHIDTSNSAYKIQSEADYARVIGQIEKAMAKKVFDN